MRRIWDWICSWFVGAGVASEVLALRRYLRVVEKEGVEMVLTLNKREAKLIGIRESIRHESGKLEHELEDAQAHIKKQDAVIAAVRSKLQICEDITIPSLVAKHRLIIATTEAEMMVQTRRQVMNTPQQTEL